MGTCTKFHENISCTNFGTIRQKKMCSKVFRSDFLVAVVKEANNKTSPEAISVQGKDLLDIIEISDDDVSDNNDDTLPDLPDL